jgi:hypothetical protein
VSGISKSTTATSSSSSAFDCTADRRFVDIFERGAGRPPRSEDDPEWVGFVAVVSSLPTGEANGRTTMLEGFRHAADMMIRDVNGRHVGSLGDRALRGVIQGAVSRLVGVFDPLVRIELQNVAPQRDATEWLDAPELSRSTDEWIQLLNEYPVLGALAGLALSQWRIASVEMVDRLATDQSELQRAFGGGGPSDRLAEVELGAGDLHNGGRAVALLRFESGAGLVYKPRDLRTTAAVQGVYELVNSTGLAPGLAIRRVLLRDGYGYEERLDARACSGPAGAVGFYERLGAQMRILQLLGARDMWADNLIAVGDDPHFVDFECVLCPDLDAPPLLSPNRRALYSRRAASVVATAIPLAAQPPRDICPTRDIGCLSHADDPIDKGGGGLSIGPFRPYDANGPVDPWHFGREVERGYRAANRALVAVGQRLLQGDGPLSEVGTLPSRFIWRDTFQYVTALHRSVQPDALTSTDSRERVLASLVADVASAADRVATRFDTSRLSTLELIALRQLDVPMFHSVAGDTEIVATDGTVMADQFAESPLSSLERRIAAISDDVEEELGTLRSATDAAAGCAGVTLLPEGMPRSRVHRSRRLASLALEVAETIAGTRESPGDGNGWLAGTRDPLTGVCDVVVAGADLLGGALGPALFFAELDAIVGASDFGALAGAVVSEQLDAVEFGLANGDVHALARPGPAAGLLGSCALAAVGTTVAAVARDAVLDRRVSEVRDLVLMEAQLAAEESRIDALAPLHHHLLTWPAPHEHMALAATLFGSSEALTNAWYESPRESDSGLSALVPTGRSAVAAALAATVKLAPALMGEPDRVADSLADGWARADTRGDRLGALSVFASGLSAQLDPPAAPRARDVGSLLMACDEAQIRSQVLGDRSSSRLAHDLFSQVLGLRRAHGRYLVGRYADDGRCLSAFDGLVAVGRLVLRVLEPSLPPVGVPW